MAYLLKPISMAELTEELRKIHDKIEKRLASLTRPQGGAEALRMVTATMLLDEYARPEPSAAAESLAKSAGMEIRGTSILWWRRSACPTGRTGAASHGGADFLPGVFLLRIFQRRSDGTSAGLRQRVRAAVCVIGRAAAGYPPRFGRRGAGGLEQGVRLFRRGTRCLT